MGTIDEQQALPLTGERTVPGVASEAYWFARHAAAYRHLAPACAGRDVVELGSGEGYGARLLGDAGAARVVGVDYDAWTTAHARARYAGGTTGFVRGNVVALPLADACADVVVGLQLLEHVWTPLELLAECRRVLRPGGLLALSTPNRLTFSPGLGRGERPADLFHVREHDADELVELVGVLNRSRTASGGLSVAALRVEALLGVHAGARLRALDDVHAAAGGFVAAQLASAPDNWDAALAADVAATTPGDFEVGPETAASLDLLLLARADGGAP